LVFYSDVGHEVVGAGVAIVVGLIKVVALGSFKRSKWRRHADYVFAGTAIGAGRNVSLRRRIHEGPP
jgi:hypothetical protein